MSNMMVAVCTCPQFWRGQHERPVCAAHPPRRPHDAWCNLVRGTDLGDHECTCSAED